MQKILYENNYWYYRYAFSWFYIVIIFIKIHGVNNVKKCGSLLFFPVW